MHEHTTIMSRLVFAHGKLLCLARKYNLLTYLYEHISHHHNRVLLLMTNHCAWPEVKRMFDSVRLLLLSLSDSSFNCLYFIFPFSVPPNCSLSPPLFSTRLTYVGRGRIEGCFSPGRSSSNQGEKKRKRRRKSEVVYSIDVITVRGKERGK